jgi:hypothetical protein
VTSGQLSGRISLVIEQMEATFVEYTDLQAAVVLKRKRKEQERKMELTEYL